MTRVRTVTIKNAIHLVVQVLDIPIQRGAGVLEAL